MTPTVFLGPIIFRRADVDNAISVDRRRNYETPDVKMPTPTEVFQPQSEQLPV